MAKNPVFPLYYNDLDRSTRDWSDEEFGAYVRLLVHQWDKGFLPKDYQRLTRIANSLDTNWGMLKPKFEEVEDGLKNMVLEAIRDKVMKHREKQKENVLKRYQKSTKNLPLENENEIECENENIIEYKGVQGETWDAVKKRWMQDFRYKEKICGDKKIEMQTLEDRMKEFISEIELKEDYKEIQALKKHFVNWNNKRYNGTTGTHRQFNATTKPISTSDSKTNALGKWVKGG